MVQASLEKKRLSNPHSKRVAVELLAGERSRHLEHHVLFLSTAFKTSSAAKRSPLTAGLQPVVGLAGGGWKALTLVRAI